ncbi:MAG: hypothetical protein AAGA54_03475 [Myxococcota bacterium]
MTGLTSTWLPAAAILLALTACSSDDAPADTDGSAVEDASTSASGSSSTTNAATETSEGADGSSSGADTTGAVDVDTAAFFTAISGLWVAPVESWTSAGSFPTMNMDVRAASEGVLFARVDLDPDNSLRFAFALEEHDGQPQLTFRNGGEFLGIPRDTRTVLQDVDGGTWRFCALQGGCTAVDARFAFDGDDGLQLDVDVFGRPHIAWPAVRREGRALQGAFPTPPVQAGDAPFPPMPGLRARTSWDVPLEQEGRVWVVLSSTTCGIDPLNNCVPSRFLSVVVPAGATEATLDFEQVHAGAYQANAILDRNGNLGAAALLPDAGDAVSLPDTPATVPARGTGEVAIKVAVDL